MKRLLLFLALFWSLNSVAQTEDITRENPELPFFIHPDKRMPDFELAEKKEGTFLTGLPRFEFDPIRGFGVGGNVNVFWNKTKEDPFFDYTAYRYLINAELFVFQNGRVKYSVNFDAPYIFDSQWRLRIDAVHWDDPNAQYWGIGRSSLDQLSFRDKRTGEDRKFARVREYEANLALAERGVDGNLFTDFHFNHMHQREQLYNILGERVFLGGKLRFMFGYEMLFTSFSSYNGQIAETAFDLEGNKVEAINRATLVDLQRADGTWDRFNLAGFDPGNHFTSMLAGAIIYDTRDFEPDPSNGVFLQYSHEHSGKWLGSEFSFDKFMVQGQYIRTLKRWRADKSRLTFAGLAAFGHIFGSKINFIEMWDLSSQAEAGGILVLGGGRSLRGFREARFLAPTVALVNLEMRARLYDFHLWRQHIAVGLTPFYDLGSVWDRPGDVDFTKWRGAPGAGARINWNQSTVIRLDFAKSREGSQFFFGFNHIF
jgi:outer membrane protein assembly factor BamA